MKTYKELVNEVAAACSPSDKEFVALHKIVKSQRVAYPEHQFKGGTKKDESKISHMSNETGNADAVEKEKPKPVAEAVAPPGQGAGRGGRPELDAAHAAAKKAGHKPERLELSKDKKYVNVSHIFGTGTYHIASGKYVAEALDDQPGRFQNPVTDSEDVAEGWYVKSDSARRQAAEAHPPKPRHWASDGAAAKKVEKVKITADRARPPLKEDELQEGDFGTGKYHVITGKHIKGGTGSPYEHAYNDAKKVMHHSMHAKLYNAFLRMDKGGDEKESLAKNSLHHDELKPILKKHNIAEDDTSLNTPEKAAKEDRTAAAVTRSMTRTWKAPLKEDEQLNESEHVGWLRKAVKASEKGDDVAYHKAMASHHRVNNQLQMSAHHDKVAKEAGVAEARFDQARWVRPRERVTRKGEA